MQNYSDFEFLDTSINHFILTVTLARPERGNALNVEIMEEIISLSSRLKKDTEIRVVIFKGSGKNFCTGADLTAPSVAEQNRGTLIEKMRALDVGPTMITGIFNIPQITIAQLHGKVLGGGACIASACDFRIATPSTMLGYPESNYNMNLSWFGLPLCVRLVGPAKAKRLVILGNREQANDLLQWGMFDELVNEAELDNYAITMAEGYAKQPPVAAQMIKRSINQLSSALDSAIMHMDKDQFILTNQSEDFREGLMAHMEKREAEFTGG